MRARHPNAGFKWAAAAALAAVTSLAARPACAQRPEAALAAAEAPALRFEREASLRENARVQAVAVAGERVAWGDLRGAWVREGEGPVRFALRRGPVTALALGPDGALLAGTERGLFAVDTEGRSRDVSPPGAAARSVRAVAHAGELRAAATADGVFVARGEGPFVRVDGALPAGEAAALALRVHGADAELWTVVDGAPWRVSLHNEGPAGWRTREAVREDGALGAVGADAVDVRLGAGGLVVVAGPDALAWRGADGAWRRHGVSLPPGAAIARLGEALGRVWLATGRGLLSAEGWSGPWRRADAPAGSVEAHAVDGDASRLVVGTAEGLLTARAASPEAPAARGAVREDRDARLEEPSIAAVQRAATAYLDLGPARLARLRDGAARRGLLPVVGLHFSRDVERGLRRNADESFVSGATRALREQELQRSRDTGMWISLEWDLGDAAFHPEELDVSREAREVIELRDDVLDEVTQLYFERRRVLLELARLAAPAGEPPASFAEEMRLRLRADELAAGLDAWTGGWFGHHARRLAP